METNTTSLNTSSVWAKTRNIFWVTWLNLVILKVDFESEHAAQYRDVVNVKWSF